MRSHWVLLLLVGCSTLVAGELRQTGRTFDCTLERVVDGDTIIVKEVIFHKIRLIDVWAPELKANGEAAKLELIELLKDVKIQVTLPVVDSTPGKTQTFDRIAGYIYINGECLNDTLGVKYPRPAGKKKPILGK